MTVTFADRQHYGNDLRRISPQKVMLYFWPIQSKTIVRNRENPPKGHTQRINTTMCQDQAADAEVQESWRPNWSPSKLKETRQMCDELLTTLPAGGWGARVSACAGLKNQLLSCWVEKKNCLAKHWHSNCRRQVDVGGGTPRPVLLTCAKKALSGVGCMISFQLPMGFQNFVVINKIHP